ncbi:helix-turn-helix domain-containing protein [Bacillus thuringiensis]|uniref:helix-turn-helix domain-containing protein n=1 Tax=Bacillus thuringiensis TaxID=1428 RepID=UPI000A3970D3|nr:helix-turn-helix domain-containing protein [Bacillus thuringiensis]MED2128568.1 helix-turn-helix domain-containing protein [Bacillus thuringiensis]MED2148328.1 helix-turn-helix domain-containing protein [Bacillus thuringiensis]MED2173078.1 helix-turn-helix domain-containing protein [Bacillus thuringiensis]MED2478883.1 helix-turn-helix domain-containing protein [Bacillus thuringiensis]MED2575929.1 helix-turn-helix domain-containing protein [Bacillus thuringiensis]
MKELRKYQSFNSITEMDNSINEYLSAYKIKESEYTVLWKLACYSCKFIGVSYLKVDSLADLTGYSKRTIQRALKVLSELGIITRINQFKPVKGGYSASITVINPYESHLAQSPCEEATEPTPEYVEEHPSHTDTITYKTKISKDNTYVDELGIDHLVAAGVPIDFASLAISYFDAPKVYKLWSRVQLAARKYAPDLVDTVEVSVSGLRASILVSKAKRVRDFNGYFYGVLAQKLSTAQRSLKCKLFNFLQ